MLRKIRITLAAISFTLVTLLFLDFTGTIHTWFGWLAKIQFVPAILALNFITVAILILLTLIFGRIYCSVICPLGILQDIISRLGGTGKKRKRRFTWSPAKNILRYTMLAVFIVAIVAGAGSIAALLEPYSAFGRIASNLLSPLWLWGNNLLAAIAEHYGSYAFYGREVWLRSLPTFIIASATLILLVILAWRNGRTYCNTVCPVGTVLGFLSKFSLFKVTIDTDKCRSCSICTKECKASCIDYKNHYIDYSRCVACMNCIDNCPHGAIKYMIRGRKEKTNTATDTSRRSFMAISAMLATSAVLKAEEKKVDGGLAVIEDKKIPERATRIVPPGALSVRNFAQHCTGCQLCVSVCPNYVLRPSASPLTLMQPEMSYERGYCRPECNKCSQVCPAGAIRPITTEEKSSTQIGHAVWVKENCIPLSDGEHCGNCARHCPSGAIQMVPIGNGNEEDITESRGKGKGKRRRQHAGGLKIPVINTERCIGCGACENLCPARPFTAIYVEGNSVHNII